VAAARRRWRGLLWRSRTAFRDETTIRFDGDLRLWSPVRNITTRRTFTHGFRDRLVFQWLDRFLRRDMVVFDLGANVGVYALHAAKRAAAVHAFEANPGLARFLHLNQSRNGLRNLRVNMVAVGETAGESLFRVDPVNLGQSHVLGSAEPSHGAVRVPIVRLDDYAAAEGIDRVDFVKLDIEGYELPALRGFVHTLRANPWIVLFSEIAAEHMARYGFEPRHLWTFMEALDFRAYALTAEGFVPFEQSSGERNAFWSRRPPR
jgi:FkbM family methyltransferase